jgi:hypothetical protein
MKVFSNRDWTIIFWTYLAVLLLTITCAMFLEMYGQQGKTMRAVYAVCNNSRLVINGQLEQACGDAQTASSTEFVCDHNDQNPSTHCWVELK